MTLLMCLLLMAFYFLPSLVAWSRRCTAGAGIVIVNLFLGWTFIGWVVALAWAASGKTRASAPLETIAGMPSMDTMPRILKSNR